MAPTLDIHVAEYEMQNLERRSLSFEHQTLIKTVVWDKDSTLINECKDFYSQDKFVLVIDLRTVGDNKLTRFSEISIDQVLTNLKQLEASKANGIVIFQLRFSKYERILLHHL